MSAVTLSSKYQVVIPREIRESMGLQAGVKFEVFEVNGRIELVPIPPIRQLRGFLKGMDPTIERDEDRI